MCRQCCALIGRHTPDLISDWSTQTILSSDWSEPDHKGVGQLLQPGRWVSCHHHDVMMVMAHETKRYDTGTVSANIILRPHPFANITCLIFNILSIETLSHVTSLTTVLLPLFDQFSTAMWQCGNMERILSEWKLMVENGNAHATCTDAKAKWAQRLSILTEKKEVYPAKRFHHSSYIKLTFDFSKY